jgi:hypothetical protein
MISQNIDLPSWDTAKHFQMGMAQSTNSWSSGIKSCITLYINIFNHLYGDIPLQNRVL